AMSARKRCTRQNSQNPPFTSRTPRYLSVMQGRTSREKIYENGHPARCEAHDQPPAGPVIPDGASARANRVGGHAHHLSQVALQLLRQYFRFPGGRPQAPVRPELRGAACLLRVRYAHKERNGRSTRRLPELLRLLRPRRFCCGDLRRHPHLVRKEVQRPALRSKTNCGERFLHTVSEGDL